MKPPDLVKSRIDGGFRAWKSSGSERRRCNQIDLTSEAARNGTARNEKRPASGAFRTCDNRNGGPTEIGNQRTRTGIAPRPEARTTQSPGRTLAPEASRPSQTTDRAAGN